MEEIPSRAKMLKAKRALMADLQLTIMFLWLATYLVLSFNYLRGIVIEFSMMPVFCHSSLFLTSKWVLSSMPSDSSLEMILGSYFSPGYSETLKALYPRMLKYPNLRSLSTSYSPLPSSTMRRTSSSGETTMGIQAAMEPLLGTQKESLIRPPSVTPLVSKIFALLANSKNYSAFNGLFAFSNKVSWRAGPERFTWASWK